MDNIIQLQSDRERRIQERRRRIKERLQAVRQGGAAHTAKGEPQDVPVGQGLQQMLESTRRIMALKAETSAMVNSYPLEADVAENWRRNAEAKRKHGLRSSMLEEAEESAKKNAAIAMHWADLFAIDVPQDLWDAMQGQKADCNSIIQSKNDLITHIKKDLKTMDNDFAKLLKQQVDDMGQMLKAMTEQMENLSGACRHELDEVEMAYTNERKALLEQNKGEMQQMFEKRNHLEQDFLERYLSLVSGYQQSLFEMQVGDAQEFNSLKLNLETDRQKLERHMEAMLATYQLNIEKLDYNYRVLVERDHENSATINQQKRKIARQRDQLTSLKARYQDSDKKFHEENMKLTSEYKRMTEQFKDLQLKFKHFELVDSRKYVEVWKMKEANIVALAKKVMAADRVLHEQQLGLKWRAPSDEVLISPYSAQAGAEAKDAAEGAEVADVPVNTNNGEEADEATMAKQLALEEMRKLRQDPRIKPAMDMITDEAGFLLEPVVRKQIEELPADEQQMLQLDTLLEALGVSDCAGLEVLVEALDPSSDVELRAKGMGTSDKASLKAQPVLVAPDDALRRLRAFVEAENASGIQGGSNKQTVAGPRPGVSRRVLEREREFWRNITKVVDDRGRRVLSSLETNLQKYYLLLQSREKSLRAVEHSGKQNMELRALLNQYLSSKINTELQIPPTQLI